MVTAKEALVTAVGRRSFLSPVGILCHHLLGASGAATCIHTRTITLYIALESLCDVFYHKILILHFLPEKSCVFGSKLGQAQKCR